MDLERCQYCNTAIRWVVTQASVLAGGELRRMPLDPDPAPDGNVVYTHPDSEEGPVKVLRKDELAGAATRYRYKAHFATCTWSRRSARGATPAARARTQKRFDAETLERERPSGGER
jgi:hypothetical protein